MTMLAEDYDYVIGGDPDRDTIDLAVLDSATGGVRAHLIATTDQTGYAQVLDWANQHSTGRRVWALEGTGSFAAGLATALAQAGEDVVEVFIGLLWNKLALNDFSLKPIADGLRVTETTDTTGSFGMRSYKFADVTTPQIAAQWRNHGPFYY
jgi:hypothetical protein